MLIEEGILFPIAMEVLTREDWKIIDEEVNTIDDPLFGSVIADEYQRLYNLIIDRTERRAVT